MVYCQERPGEGHRTDPEVRCSPLNACWSILCAIIFLSIFQAAILRKNRRLLKADLDVRSVATVLSVPASVTARPSFGRRL